MKIAQLIFIIFTIVCNEIVVELVLSEDHKVSILDSACEENTECENIELESEAETDFFNDRHFEISNSSHIELSSLHLSVNNISKPFLEIHSPPPELIKI